jgi:hypothetical protein
LSARDEVLITGALASRLRSIAEQYGFEAEGFIDYLLTVLQGVEPALPKKGRDQDEFVEVLERLKNLGYT